MDNGMKIIKEKNHKNWGQRRGPYIYAMLIKKS